MEHDLHDVICRIQRSIRYHKARERFFRFWSGLAGMLCLLAGSAVVVSILAQGPGWLALGCGAVVAVAQAAEAVLGWSGKASAHSGFASEFAALERTMALLPETDARTLKNIGAEILRIEAREPPIYRYLDLICHNQVARAIGSDDVEHLAWWQRTFAHILPGASAMETLPRS
ncbi:MAG: hypothetical protein GDA52_02580 [Rhodobacteraceae bacterium]|nr:hypothetical protein [Paracoccaceae bacterium]